MKKFVSFVFLTLFIVIFFVLQSCTIAGLELGLVGTWKATKVEVDGKDVSSAVKSTHIINNDDTYSWEFKNTITNEVYNEKGVILKADSVLKNIIFKPKDGDQYTATYKLDLNILILNFKNEGYDFRITYSKM